MTDDVFTGNIIDYRLPLRDQFAMAALTGLLADRETRGEIVTEWAYQYADAMLKAREEQT